MSRVFVVQEDPRKNVLPALDFGEIETIMSARDQITITSRVDHYIEMFRGALFDFSEDDYILAIGDPVAIGIACAIASSKTGGVFKMLKWDRQERMYYPVKVDFTGKRTATRP